MWRTKRRQKPREKNKLNEKKKNNNVFKYF